MEIAEICSWAETLNGETTVESPAAAATAVVTVRPVAAMLDGLVLDEEPDRELGDELELASGCRSG